MSKIRIMIKIMNVGISFQSALYCGLKMMSQAWAIRMVIIMNGNAVFMKPIKLIL